MADRIPVLVNAAGGTAARLGAALAARIEAAFAGAGAAIDLQLLHGAAIHDAIRRVAGASTVVVGGGDGTLGCAAGILGGTNSALGILPLGTHNHLARELGIPLDLAGAARMIAAHTVRRIDLGRVNDHVFVNNASIGLYPSLVRRRDDTPAPKWLAAVPAGIAALRRVRRHRLHLVVPGRDRHVVTPLLFVGNNHYALERGQVGTRTTLDDGRLSIYVVASRSRLALIGFALRTLAGRSDPLHDFAMVGDVTEALVEGHGHRIAVAIDGEVVDLAMPLRFASDPGALAVLAPLSGIAASPRPGP